MTATLSSINTTKVLSDETADLITSDMAVIDLPPGFVQPVDRPIVYIGGSEEGGQPFYQWNRDTNSKEFIPVNRFSATLTDIKTIIKNADDEDRRSCKVVMEFQTASGGQVAISVGAKTWAAMGIVSGLSGMSSDQLQGEVGLWGRVGRKGVTFISTFADGGCVRHPDSEELLKESRKDGAQEEAIVGLVGEIRKKLKA